MDTDYELLICSDCLIWHANADDTGFCQCEGPACTVSEHEDIRTAAALTDLIAERRFTIAVGDEAGFMTRGCDACGSRFGGDKHEATLFVQGPPVRTTMGLGRDDEQTECMLIGGEIVR